MWAQTIHQKIQKKLILEGVKLVEYLCTDTTVANYLEMAACLYRTL